MPFYNHKINLLFKRKFNLLKMFYEWEKLVCVFGSNAHYEWKLHAEGSTLILFIRAVATQYLYLTEG